jgi:pSer/pThr/pTyr-binding forkhead associated (FHA) protein
MLSESERVLNVPICPACGTDEVRRSMRRGAIDRVMAAFGKYPYRCANYMCGKRFYDRKFDRTAIEGDDRSASLVVPATLNDLGLERGADFNAAAAPKSKFSSSPDGNTLFLYWQDGESQQVKQLVAKDRRGNPSRLKIGRNPKLCDLVFTDLSVSGEHVEVYYDLDRTHFYLRTLRATNPPTIDGNSIADVICLQPGMLICLGRQEIAVDVCIAEIEIEPTVLNS